MTDQPYRDPLLRHLIRHTADAPDTVTAPSGKVVPLSVTAAGKLAARLPAVAQMHHDGELNDAQLLAAVRLLVNACEATSELHHLLSPEQIEATRRGAIAELAGLTEADLAELGGLPAL